jgi:hypothetical protein
MAECRKPTKIVKRREKDLKRYGIRIELKRELT